MSYYYALALALTLTLMPAIAFSSLEHHQDPIGVALGTAVLVGIAFLVQGVIRALKKKS